MNRPIRIFCLLAILFASGVVRAQTPADRGPGAQIRRFAENLAKLDLSPQQQQQVKAVIDDMTAKLEELKRAAKPDDRPMQKVAQIMSDGRSRLTEILTPAQQQKLRDLMQQDRAEQVKRDEPMKPEIAKAEPKKTEPKPEPKAEPKKSDAKPEPKMDTMTGAAAGPAVVRRDRPAPGPLEKLQPIDPGAQAPEFTLKSTADKNFSLTAYKGKVVVLVFGSYTCPLFRQRIAAMEKLAKDTSLKATFLVIYTREAHALGEWEVERNKDENIQIEQPKTDAERIQMAKQAVSTLKITLPVLVDPIDDPTVRAYGLMPNGAVVIGRDGKVAARQRWFEPVSLKQQIDTAATARVATN